MSNAPDAKSTAKKIKAQLDSVSRSANDAAGILESAEKMSEVDVKPSDISRIGNAISHIDEARKECDIVIKGE